MLRKRLNSRMLGIALAAACAVLYLCAPASAAYKTYTVESCQRAGAAQNYSTGNWSRDETQAGAGALPYFFTSVVCDAYGMYRRFENTTIPYGASSGWTFTAPPGTWIDSATLYQTITALSPGTSDSVIAELEDGGRRTLATYVGGSGTTGDRTYTMPTGAAHTMRLRTELACGSQAGCQGYYYGGYGNVWQILGTSVRVVDPTTPSFTDVSGVGWQATPPDGVNGIHYAVSDVGSGITSVSFLVDGILYLQHRNNCLTGYIQPCSLVSSGQFMLDTTRLAEGTHTVAVTVDDFAGNTTLASDKQMTITVRRPPAASTSAPVTTTNPSWNGGGSPAVGDQLAGTNGSWSGTGNTYTYQWQRCDAQGLNCVPITGATGITYTPTSADTGSTLVFCVTATNTGGSTTSCSAPTPVVIASHPSPTTSTGTQTADVAPTNVGSPAPQTTETSAATTTPQPGSTGSRAPERVVLTAITNNRSTSQKVKFGKRVPISGRLVGPNGQPIADAVLSVQVQTATPGAAMADAASLKTGSDGRFLYWAPAGPSRTIRFGYRASTSDSAFADTTDVHLLVSAGVTIKATPKKVRNKHATVFTGRLLGKPLSKRGVVVDLQVFFRKQWRTFGAPRTNSKGVYRFKYRFMAGAATWRFRARVRKDGLYPYESGLSGKQVRVKVTS